MIDKITEEKFLEQEISGEAFRCAAEISARQELKELQKKDSRYLDPMTAYKFLKEQSLFLP